MRILVVSALYPPVAYGGYETRCADTVDALRERGHEIVVLSSDHRREEAGSDDGVLRELPHADRGLEVALRAPLASLSGVRVAERVLAEFRPELVFFWLAGTLPRAALRTLETSGVPVAYSLADTWLAWIDETDHFTRYLPGGREERYHGPVRGPRRAWGTLMRAVNRHPRLRVDLDEQVAAGICWASNALREGTPLPPSVRPVLERVIHPAARGYARFELVERAPAEQPTILYAGRLESEKAPDVAYRALAEVRSRHGIDARLVLAGHAEPDVVEELGGLARELGIEEHVERVGRVDTEALARLYAQAHALVFPSRWMEPFGRTVVEAALARVPVVAARTGGVPEALAEDEQALFFPVDDHAACADALASALTDSGATAARVQRAHERARELTFEDYVDQMDRFMADTLEALGRPAAEPVA